MFEFVILVWLMRMTSAIVSLTDSDSGSSSSSELDMAKTSEPLSATKVIGIHMVDVVVFWQNIFFLVWPVSLSKQNCVLQENVGFDLTSDQNKGDPGNSETGKGEYQSLWQ